MSFEFPFAYARISGIGVLFYPVVLLQIKTVVGWREFEFLVDTGADLTTFPSTILPLLGLDLAKLTRGEVAGVGGLSVSAWESEILLKIGDEELSVSCNITGDRTTPFLLGKKDIFEKKFSLEIDSKRQVTILRLN